MDRVKQNQSFLNAIATTKRAKDGRALMRSAKPTQLDAVCEIIVNILHGVVPISDGLKKKTARHKTVIRKLAKKCLKKLKRKELFVKYFAIIKRLIAAALPLIGLTLTAIQFASS
jgi:hypothetical protein